jgi:hypothetical protein
MESFLCIQSEVVISQCGVIIKVLREYRYYQKLILHVMEDKCLSVELQ